MAMIASDLPARHFTNKRVYKINQAIPDLCPIRYRRHDSRFKILARATFIKHKFQDPLAVEKFIARHYID